MLTVACPEGGLMCLQTYAPLNSFVEAADHIADDSTVQPKPIYGLLLLLPLLGTGKAQAAGYLHELLIAQA